MNFKIRQATANDMPKVLELIKELASFEKETNAVEVTAEDLVNDGYGDKKYRENEGQGHRKRLINRSCKIWS